MTQTQKAIKYIAIALAVALTVSIISGIAEAIGIFTLIFDDDSAIEDKMTSYEVFEDISSLDLLISAAAFQIKEGEKLYVESNLKNLQIEEKKGTLTILDESKFNRNSNGARLVLYVPKDILFEEVSIETGAGKVSIDFLSCHALSLTLGAGDFEAENLSVLDECDISGGVGKLTINGSINNLDLEMGVGDITLISELHGENKLDFGVGNAEIQLIGSKDDYSINLEKGIGSIRLNGDKISSSETYYGEGVNRVEIEGGVGNIEITLGE